MLCSHQKAIILEEEMYTTIFLNLYKKNVQNVILPDTALEAISARTIPTSDKLIFKIKLSL